MLPLVVLGAALEQLRVEGLQIVEVGHGYEEIAAVVADLVLHAALLVPGGGVAERQGEAEVLLEATEPIGEGALPTPQDLPHDGGGVVEPQPGWNPTDEQEDRDQSLEQALRVLSGNHLQETGIAVREGDTEVEPVYQCALQLIIGLSEVHLRLPGSVDQRQGRLGVPAQLPLALPHIGGNRAVGAGEPLLSHQPVVDALGGVPLLAPSAPVLLQPGIDRGLEALQNPWPTPRRPLCWLVPVLLLEVLAHRLSVDALLFSNPADAVAFLKESLPDIMDLGHCKHPPLGTSLRVGCASRRVGDPPEGLQWPLHFWGIHPCKGGEFLFATSGNSILHKTIRSSWRLRGQLQRHVSLTIFLFSASSNNEIKNLLSIYF